MKTIPFDIDKAKQGAKVVTADGLPVEIVNYHASAIPGWPIVGRYIKGDGQEYYEIWPASGTFEEIDQVGRKTPLPPDLRIEVEAEPAKGYSVQGQSITKDGKPLFAVFLNSPTDVNIDELLETIATALNLYELPSWPLGKTENN